METSLHRQLKQHYATDEDQTEVRCENFRIDAISGGELIEIQLGSLAALRTKARRLLETHRLRIVKPIVARKVLVRQDRKDGQVIGRRLSPKRGSLLDLFGELVHFTRVFPHPRLTIEVALVEIEEWRYPGHGRRRRWRLGDHVVADQRLVAIGDTARVATARDLVELLGVSLPATFDTADLARELGVPRWIAQRIAYCLRETGAAQAVGKQGNAWRYRVAAPRKKRARRA